MLHMITCEPLSTSMDANNLLWHFYCIKKKKKKKNSNFYSRRIFISFQRFTPILAPNSQLGDYLETLKISSVFLFRGYKRIRVFDISILLEVELWHLRKIS